MSDLQLKLRVCAYFLSHDAHGATACDGRLGADGRQMTMENESRDIEC